MTIDEMKIYVEIPLLTGYMNPKNIRMFWETKSDGHNDLASAMPRNIFLEIHQYLHTCDNTQLAQNDIFTKLSSYFKMLNELFGTNFEFVSTKQVSI